MTSTSEIAETKILSPFFSSVVMIRRAVGESCFESERYQITAWVSRTTAIRKHPAGSCPTFRDGLRRCLLHSLSHPVSTKDLTGFAEVRSRIFPAVNLQRQEPPLAFEEVVREAFQALAARQSSGISTHLQPIMACGACGASPVAG